ncbi:MAG TPA: GNAT family N-acetyltransferase [Gemmatimonadaceae bacterium]|nr:GNAT family N-acetyltransferase [Gemmatimonadaceae bacterium]
MSAPSDLRPAGMASDVRVLRARDCPASFYRYLYREVGRRHYWRDRLDWTDEQILALLEDAAISLSVMYREGSPLGFFELRSHADGSVEIAYFGLLPEVVGQGLGKQMLSAAVEAAWSSGASRVWLHTCTLDSPAALPNYIARGFRPFREERYEVELSPDL